MLAILIWSVGQTGEERELCSFLYLTDIAALIMLILLPPVLINMYQDIETSPDGVRIGYFWFWSRFIPWAEVVDVRRVWRWTNRVMVVEVKRATPVHLIYGRIYARKPCPAFLVFSMISEYRELIATIQRQTKQSVDSDHDP
jgi:hypothetical protein